MPKPSGNMVEGQNASLLILFNRAASAPYRKGNAMKRSIFTALTLAAALPAGAALAAFDRDARIAELQADGYDRIEVKDGPTQTKIEAMRGDEELEEIYDEASGDLLKMEFETGESDDMPVGVKIRQVDKDFLRGSDDDDDHDDD